MTAKHTPIPFRAAPNMISRGRGPKRRTLQDGIDIHDGNDSCIAHVYALDIDDDESVNNRAELEVAALIVRAVNSHDDLVRACERLVAIEGDNVVVCSYCQSHRTKHAELCPVRCARAALALAKGGAE